MLEKLIIIGTGDYAEVAYHFLNSRYDIICFMVNKDYMTKTIFCDKEVKQLESLKDFDPKAFKLFIAIGPNGNNKTRERIYLDIKKHTKFNFIKFIHPDSYVWSDHAIGENTMVYPKCIVEPFAVIGDNCVLWSNCLVAHHSTIGNHSFLAPSCSISGRVTISNNCFIGINSTIRDNINIKSNTIVGAGSIIKKDTEENGVYSQKRTHIYNKNSLNTKV